MPHSIQEISQAALAVMHSIRQVEPIPRGKALREEECIPRSIAVRE